MEGWHWGLDKGKVVPSILTLFQTTPASSKVN
jgi:hypothetical protein